MTFSLNQQTIFQSVSNALEEDLSNAMDISAQLITASSVSQGNILTRDAMILCGTPWANEAVRQFAPDLNLQFAFKDGEAVPANTVIATISGKTQAILTIERTILNFLQMLSATATSAQQYVKQLENTSCRLLDTRKTIPGHRMAQKYAVTCGGGKNHRMGLYDAFLIKENHINACGSIQSAVTSARTLDASKAVEIEVESLDELKQALDAGADIVMLDNFSMENLVKAVKINDDRAKLEASGNINMENIRSIAETGVDFVSVGAITKHVMAIDLSLRFDDQF